MPPCSECILGTVFLQAEQEERWKDTVEQEESWRGAEKALV